jgi:hypothetical protein
MGLYVFGEFVLNKLLRVLLNTMKTFKLISLAAAAYLCTSIGQVSAMTVDTIDVSSGQANTYFVPSLGQEFDSPYFRREGQDWGWQHNAIGAMFATASLSISAWDVDNPSTNPNHDDEIDVIQAYSTDLAAWVDVGVLAGTSDAFSYTTFNLDNSWFNEIAAGLMVQILIDELDQDNYWGVSLAKSVLSLDGAPLPNPNPGAVPVPAALWLFGTALAGLAGFGRRKQKI